MDLSELERLVQIVNNAAISDLTIRQGEARITLRKAVSPPGVSPGAMPRPYAYTSEDEPVWEGVVEEEESDDAEAEERTLWVTAPLVGIFHHVKPIVGLGAKVAQGQVVGVIEAMKLITEVTAPGSGVVVDTLIEEGLPVEYGQHLFTVQPQADVS
ncbi:MAG TPA: biotin/lipoyl-containing protein [Chthonomonadaceae bacterium]|nr:biotin/lipoyl-containing protein [Chthonomonadaceae bacterium]